MQKRETSSVSSVFITRGYLKPNAQNRHPFHHLPLETLRHLQSFVFAFNEQVQNFEKSKTSIVESFIVFRHCEGKDSREAIRYTTYQAKLNQH